MSQDIMDLLLAITMQYTDYTIILMIRNSVFYRTGWYYEYRETFRHGVTAESRFADCHGLRTWIFAQTLWTEAN